MVTIKGREGKKGETPVSLEMENLSKEEGNEVKGRIKWEKS